MPCFSRKSYSKAVFIVIWSLATLPACAEPGNAKKGESVFTKNNCYICHPGGGNALDPGHPIKGARFAQKYKDERLLEQTIRKGFKDSGMPSNDKSKISDAEMKDLIAFVRALNDASSTSKTDDASTSLSPRSSNTSGNTVPKKTSP
jgi:mono/diheme cytochrome c family protein